MATIFWTRFGYQKLTALCEAMTPYSKLMTWAAIWMLFALFLLIFHIIMVAYEQNDIKSHDQIKTNLQLTEKRKAEVLVSKSKNRNLNKFYKNIEEKFSKSSMNKAYAFPRKDDRQPILTENAF